MTLVGFCVVAALSRYTSGAPECAAAASAGKSSRSASAGSSSTGFSATGGRLGRVASAALVQQTRLSELGHVAAAELLAEQQARQDQVDDVAGAAADAPRRPQDQRGAAVAQQ